MRITEQKLQEYIAAQPEIARLAEVPISVRVFVPKTSAVSVPPCEWYFMARAGAIRRIDEGMFRQRALDPTNGKCIAPVVFFDFEVTSEEQWELTYWLVHSSYTCGVLLGIKDAPVGFDVWFEDVILYERRLPV